MAGLWTNKDTFAVRTRAGSLEKLGPVVSVMLESVRLNPKWVEVGSNAWNHRWVNEHGEAVYSDDPNFDPKRMGLEGFVRSPVRKRFPDR